MFSFASYLSHFLCTLFIVLTCTTGQQYTELKCETVFPWFQRLMESPGFFPKIFRTWKVVEIEFDPGKSWNLPVVQLNQMPFMYRTLCVNKCVKYSCYVLTESRVPLSFFATCDE